jgi:hypothetical protein
MLSHGQKRDQLPKIDRAFSILGLWHRGFAAGGSLRPFRLPPFVTVLDVRAIAECRVLDERKPPLLARSPGRHRDRHPPNAVKSSRKAAELTLSQKPNHRGGNPQLVL